MEVEVKEKEENIPLLLNCLMGNGIKVYACNPKEIKLEEIFERLIKS
jgi:hypothetical protein